MDDLTRERFGRSVPWREALALPKPPRPVPVVRARSTPEQVAERRRVLVEGESSVLRALRRAQALAEAIRRSA